jgi:hypothetical protein
LTKARADDLRNLPLQDTDLLLHESGAPPIHTPLDVLLKLPQRIKKRMYVVHTSSLPADCELRVAPTGTAGTIRLDQFQKKGQEVPGQSTWMDRSVMKQRNSRDAYSISLGEDDDNIPSPWNSSSNEYGSISEEGDYAEEGNYSAVTTGDSMRPGLDVPRSMNSSFAHLQVQNKGGKSAHRSSVAHRSSLMGVGGSVVPLVSLRPSSSTDAWFILNLLSAVPFLSR